MRASTLLLSGSLLATALVASACTAKLATDKVEERATEIARQKVDALLPDGVTIRGLERESSAQSNQQKSAPVKKLGQTGLPEGSGDGSGEGSGDGSGSTVVGTAAPVVPVRATPVVTQPARPVTSWNAVTFTGGNGLGCNAAVIITGASDQMVGSQAEYYWLRKVYPGNKESRINQGLCGDKKTHIHEITTADGRVLEVVFDISSFAP